MYRTETDLSHLSNAVRAFVGIGTVFASEPVAEISSGLVPPSLWIRKRFFYSILSGKMM